MVAAMMELPIAQLTAPFLQHTPFAAQAGHQRCSLAEWHCAASGEPARRTSAKRIKLNATQRMRPETGGDDTIYSVLATDLLGGLIL